MENPTTTLLNNSPLPENEHIWGKLKQAIAASSGFKRWQNEQSLKSFTLEEQVRLYLEDTLSTLAY
ncbi:MAG: hypothetical protein WCO81_05325 [Cyanobacteriota bacterium ELA615]|jgi:hypothetical protein